MLLSLLMKISGTFLLALAIAHVFFPRQFQWKEQLRSLSLLNRQMFLVHSFFIALILVAFGLMNLFLTEDLLNHNRLGKAVVAGMGVFWFLRLLVQLFIYDSSLWKGNFCRTAIHFFFISFWTSLVLIHIVAFLE
ncbi:hypothetical protein L0222_19155 [bacterium]|nr:hypothetical protein [bacterium]MCI0605543.1 hypothetical protein [bacterium]